MKDFNPLNHTAIYLTPDFLSFTSAWEQHIPFAFLLTRLAEPEVVVELGTHKGDSYLAFCQAVSTFKLGTKCFAVDNWIGEEHSGTYDENIYDTLKGYHDPLYANFSTLIRKSFDDAVSDFKDGSIDILHIDGLHTYEAVSNDYYRWKEKLSKKSVVVFHDTQVRDRDFGVWKLWGELSKLCPSFEFHHGSGLGVLGIGGELPVGIKEFFSLPEDQHESLRALFANLGHRISVVGALRKSEVLREALRISLLEQDKKVISRGRELDLVKAELSRGVEESEKLRAQIGQLEGELLNIKQVLSNIESSKSWKLARLLGARAK